jgi:hypothetical protein
MRVNVKRILDEQERSAAWLARKMVEHGCTVPYTSVWRMIAEDRKINLDEALTIATILDSTLAELVAP